MPHLHGGCHCGNVTVQVQLTLPAASYRPRVCDCSFCRKHGAAYLSDPEGSLLLKVREAGKLGSYRQGSALAEMLVCRRCGVLLGALCRENDATYGVVNCRVLDAADEFGTEQSVSPQTLPPEQKLQRWRQLWFARVTLTAAD
jgi:hypothetical protein